MPALVATKLIRETPTAYWFRCTTVGGRTITMTVPKKEDLMPRYNDPPTYAEMDVPNGCYAADCEHKTCTCGHLECSHDQHTCAECPGMDFGGCIKFEKESR